MKVDFRLSEETYIEEAKKVYPLFRNVIQLYNESVIDELKVIEKKITVVEVEEIMLNEYDLATIEREGDVLRFFYLNYSLELNRSDFVFYADIWHRDYQLYSF